VGKDDLEEAQLPPNYLAYALGSTSNWLMNYAETKVNQREK